MGEHLLAYLVVGILSQLPPPIEVNKRYSVALDLNGLDQDAYKKLDALNLEKRAVLRLVQEGFAVVSSTASPDLAVRISRTRQGVLLEIPLPHRVLKREIAVRDESLDEVHLEISQKIVELAREASGGSPDIGSVAPLEMNHSVPSLPPRRPVSQTELSAGFEALWRGAPADPLVRIEGTFWPNNIYYLQLSAAMAFSSGAGVHVYEPQLQAGAGYSVGLSEHLRVSVGALLGILVHRYSMDDSSALNAVGGRTDFLLAAPVRLHWRIGSSFTLGLRAAPGWANNNRTHVQFARPIWTRSALRIEAGIFFGLRL